MYVSVACSAVKSRTVPQPSFVLVAATFRPSLSAASILTMALMWLGVVPQHPPSTLTPCALFADCAAANVCGDTPNTAFPSTTCGKPAFGCASTGRCAYLQNCCASASSSSRLPPQLNPSTSTPSDS